MCVFAWTTTTCEAARPAHSSDALMSPLSRRLQHQPRSPPPPASSPARSIRRTRMRPWHGGNGYKNYGFIVSTIGSHRVRARWPKMAMAMATRCERCAPCIFILISSVRALAALEPFTRQWGVRGGQLTVSPEAGKLSNIDMHSINTPYNASVFV